MRFPSWRLTMCHCYQRLREIENLKFKIDQNALVTNGLRIERDEILFVTIHQILFKGSVIF